MSLNPIMSKLNEGWESTKKFCQDHNAKIKSVALAALAATTCYAIGKKSLIIAPITVSAGCGLMAFMDAITQAGGGRVLFDPSVTNGAVSFAAKTWEWYFNLIKT